MKNTRFRQSVALSDVLPALKGPRRPMSPWSSPQRLRMLPAPRHRLPSAYALFSAFHTPDRLQTAKPNPDFSASRASIIHVGDGSIRCRRGQPPRRLRLISGICRPNAPDAFPAEKSPRFSPLLSMRQVGRSFGTRHRRTPARCTGVPEELLSVGSANKRPGSSPRASIIPPAFAAYSNEAEPDHKTGIEENHHTVTHDVGLQPGDGQGSAQKG